MYKMRVLLSTSLLSSLVIISILCIEQIPAEQKYPTRAIEIIVPFSAGGGTDMSNRTTAAYLAKKWGVPVNVTNKPGGSTVPATLEVYKAAPDGYTILGDGNASSSMLNLAVKHLPFKVLDRTFIAGTTSTPMVLFVGANSPYKTLNDLITDIKKDPENLRWGSTGSSTVADIAIRQFLTAIGVNILKTKPITVEGAPPAITLVGGGHAKLGGSAPAAVAPAIKSGIIRGLLVTSSKRDPDIPEVPTGAELGYPTVNIINWHGISGPPKIPSYIVDEWNKALQELAKDPEMATKYKKFGLTINYLKASELESLVKQQTQEMEELFKLK